MRKLIEIKSPLPAFTKCVKNNVLPLRPCRPPRKWRERERLSIVLREVTNLGFRGGVKNKTLTSSTIHQLNMKGGGTQHRRVLIKNSPLLPPVLDYSGCPKTQRFRTPYELTPCRKAAFTLAEVLITLGIIGVVAAMTLPGLVAKYKDKVMIAQVKKSYAAIQNAFNSAAFEMSGDSRNIASIFDSGNVNDAGNIIFKNMKVLKTCLPNTEGCTVDTVKFPKAKNDGYGKSRGIDMKSRYRVVLQDGSSVTLNKFNNEGSCLTTFTDYEKDADGNYIFDDDGNRIPVVSQQYQCGQLIIDGNGMKGPNQIGADVFFFIIAPDRIYSYISDIDTVLLDEMLEYVDYTVGSDMN